MARRKPDTRALGLDVGLNFVHWLTGAENLHYGYWEGLEVNAGNLGAAQEAYTAKLFELLPPAPARVLDIGGGAGETAKKLLAMGYDVEIVVPSALLARRCRENAPGATVHHMGFEEFTGLGPFDLCLFSESFQYIRLDTGLRRCLDILTPGGVIIVSDVFRTPEYKAERLRTKVGGGHRLDDYRALLETLPLKVDSEEDITEATAPSVEVEQGLFNVIGMGLTRIDEELTETKPKTRWLINRAIRMLLSEKRRSRLNQRLNEKTRNRDEFAKYNRYIMTRLSRCD